MTEKCFRCMMTFRTDETPPPQADVTRCAEWGCGRRYAHGESADGNVRVWAVDDDE